MTKDAMEWITKHRKLDEPLLAHHGVKVVDHPQLGSVLAFPYKRNSESYAAKFRRHEPKDWRSTQGVSRGLFNEDCLKEGTSPIVITEGEMDALSCIQAGFTRSVSLPDGWTEDGGKRECLIAEIDRLKKSEFVIVAGDNDKTGKSLPTSVANILLGHDVRYVTWPDDCKDANDVLVKHGEGELARCLNAAKQLDPEGGYITGISDLPPLPDRRVLRTGMQPYDSFMAFEVGAMSVGTGIPGHGKSTFTTFAAYHVAKNENIKVGMLAFETHPYRIRDHLGRLSIGKAWDELSQGRQEDTAVLLDNHFKIVHRDFEGMATHSLGWLKNMVYTLAVRDNCKMIIIDPWNELEHLPEAGESLTNYINFALQQIRTWATRFDCHICVIAHPKKIGGDGKERAPVGYDIADSAAFANKPALGFTVHQEKDENDIDCVAFNVWKVRDTQLYGFGKGRLRLLFDAYKMSYFPYRPQEQSNA